MALSNRARRIIGKTMAARERAYTRGVIEVTAKLPVPLRSVMRINEVNPRAEMKMEERFAKVLASEVCSRLKITDIEEARRIKNQILIFYAGKAATQKWVAPKTPYNKVNKAIGKVMPFIEDEIEKRAREIKYNPHRN